jgi:hypothetical protein
MFCNMMVQTMGWTLRTQVSGKFWKNTPKRLETWITLRLLFGSSRLRLFCGEFPFYAYFLSPCLRVIPITYHGISVQISFGGVCPHLLFLVGDRFPKFSYINVIHEIPMVLIWISMRLLYHIIPMVLILSPHNQGQTHTIPSVLNCRFSRLSASPPCCRRMMRSATF